MGFKVIEYFTSIQGEGEQIGTPMFFLRLAGCNLRCTWCDTKYSWSEKMNTNNQAFFDMTTEDVVDKLQESGMQWLCLTGGEPLLQCVQIGILLDRISDIKVTIETNGTLLPTYDVFQKVDVMTVSPKLSNSGNDNAVNLNTLAKLLNHRHPQLKFVIDTKKDMDEAESLCLELQSHDALGYTPIIFQPMSSQMMNLDVYFDKMKFMIEAAKYYVKIRDWNVRVMPQLHRIIWGNRRGI